MFSKIREWLNKNSAVVTVLAVVLLIVSLGIIILSLTPKRYTPKIVDVYYYDLTTGKIFLGKSNLIPPIPSPTGATGPGGMPGGVRAYLYACGDCPTDMANLTIEQLYAQKVFIGWLEMYTPDSKMRMEQMAKGEYRPEMPGPEGPEMIDLWEQGHLIRAFESEEWVQANSEPGFTIMQELQSMCGPDVMPKPCFPGRK